MPELLWFLAGTVISLVTVYSWRRLCAARQTATRRAPAAAPTPPPRPDAKSPQPKGVRSTEPEVSDERRAATDTHGIAMTMAEELANLVSGVEGQAHHLIEAAPTRASLPAAAEALLMAVNRLRTLHKKLLAFGKGRPASVGSTDVDDVVQSLGRELPELQLGLLLGWESRPLPRLAVPHDVALDALLFLCAALLRAERGATHLTVAAEICFANADPQVQLELALEWAAEPNSTNSARLGDAVFTLDLEAANNLIVDHGGDLSVFHLPGCSVRAVVHWPTVARAVANAPTPAPTSLERSEADETTPSNVGINTHQYGGTLVLESDPAIRALVANELKTNGRAVFACADGAAACSLLQATPDRFELLIVDHAQRLDDGGALAQAIRTLVPELKIFVLGQGTKPTLPAWPQLHFLPKPFGVHELRRALASVLAAG